MTVTCACGCLTEATYPVSAPWVTLLFSDNNTGFYLADRQHYMRFAEGTVNLWLAGSVGSALTGYPDAYHPEEAA